jgi:hypothetical protein
VRRPAKVTRGRRPTATALCSSASTSSAAAAAARQHPDASCEKLLELLRFLCGEDEDSRDHPPLTTWVLKWLAYPLQHLGAKMQTALVFHGRKASARTQFFGAVREIYGEHGTYITQRELEDKFNVWMSAKLFVVANEVVTRQEMSHQAGFLRNLITEPEIWINRKAREQFVEANHMNIVLFSNESSRCCSTPTIGASRSSPRRAASRAEYYDAVRAEIAQRRRGSALPLSARICRSATSTSTPSRR